MDPLTVVSAVEQVAEHLRKEMLRGRLSKPVGFVGFGFRAPDFFRCLGTSPAAPKLSEGGSFFQLGLTG